jgi:hypothetical protein
MPCSRELSRLNRVLSAMEKDTMSLFKLGWKWKKCEVEATVEAALKVCSEGQIEKLTKEWYGLC